jgi:hypothetical protein
MVKRTAGTERDLLVSARFGNNVLRYAGGTGAAQGQFNMGPALGNPAGLALDQGGNAFVANLTRTRCSSARPANARPAWICRTTAFEVCYQAGEGGFAERMRQIAVLSATVYHGICGCWHSAASGQLRPGLAQA